MVDEVMNSLTEFWYTNMFGEGRTLICSTNDLLRKQKQGLSSIWDDWITGKVGTNQGFSIYSPKANKLRNTANMLIALIC